MRSPTIEIVLARAVRFGIVVTCSFLVPHGANAQFRLDIEQVAEQAFSELDVEPGDLMLQEDGDVVLRGGRAIAVANRVVAGPDMERFVFQKHRSEAATRSHFEQELMKVIKEIGRDTRLTASQKRKLQLAGQGDIALLMAEANKFRAAFEGAAFDGRDQIVQLVNDARPLQQKLQADLFRDGSIFDRVLAGLQDGKQLKQFHTAKLRVMRDFYRGAVRRVITKIDRMQPLNEDQRQRIMQLMLASPELPDIDFSVVGAKHIVEFALFQLAERRTKLARILDRQQLEKLEPIFKEALAMEDTLRDAGYLR